MFSNHVNFSRIIVKVSLTGLLGALLLIAGTVYIFSQMNGVEIGPSHTQKVTSGQTVVYDHVLTNNTTSTDTFSLEVHSTQGWSVELLGGIYPTGTVLLPLQVGAQMTAPFQISLTVPLGASGITEITFITATSQISPTVWDTTTDTTIVLSQVYLPLVLKRWPPIPYRPTLDAIQGADDGNYTVSWTESPSRLANTYILQEAKDSVFTIELREVCTTAQQSCSVNSKIAGTYYYRVRGYNSWGYGEWSNVQSANVLLPDMPTLNLIDNIDGDGSFTVSWNAVARAAGYTLQEDITPSFSNPATVYNGAQTSWAANGKVAGTYYYRVLATGTTGQSNWSTTQSVAVLPPSTPYLNPIDNADGDGYYTISWNAAARATSYTLEEASNAAFNNPKTLYSGAGQSWSVSNQPYGTYYYRVTATGTTGQSALSNTQTATVPAPPPVSVLNNHTTYASSGGSYRYVVGEVYNNTASYLQFVKIAVNFYNGSQLVATDYTYTHLWDLHPYEKTCFSIMLENPSNWTHYAFEPVSYWTDGEVRPNLTVTTHSGGVYGGSYYRIIGQIRNDESSQISFVSAVGTLYNSIGKVLDCDYSYVNSTDLNPGQVSSFEILAGPPSPSAVTSYVLQTDGNR